MRERISASDCDTNWVTSVKVWLTCWLARSVICPAVLSSVWQIACCCAIVCAPTCCHSLASLVAMSCMDCVQAAWRCCSAVTCSAWARLDDSLMDASTAWER